MWATSAPRCHRCQMLRAPARARVAAFSSGCAVIAIASDNIYAADFRFILMPVGPLSPQAQNRGTFDCSKAPPKVQRKSTRGDAPIFPPARTTVRRRRFYTTPKLDHPSSVVRRPSSPHSAQLKHAKRSPGAGHRFPGVVTPQVTVGCSHRRAAPLGFKAAERLGAVHGQCEVSPWRTV